MTNSNESLIDRLEKLATHLADLDSASGEAKLLREAVATIESMEDSLSPNDVAKEWQEYAKTLQPIMGKFELGDVERAHYAGWQHAWKVMRKYEEICGFDDIPVTETKVITNV